MEQQNNNQLEAGIVEKLLRQKASTQDVTPVTDTELSGSAMRVINTKYKVYLLIVAALAFFLLQFFFFPALDAYQSSQNSLQNIVLQLQNFDAKRLAMLDKAALYKKIQEQESQIVECYNLNNSCEALDPAIKEQFTGVVAFLKFNSLQDPKLGVDEQRILRNINEYLTRAYPQSSNDRTLNADLQNIQIGESVDFGDGIYRLPIAVTARFVDKDALLSFVRNVEWFVPADPSARIYYMIDQVDYDIAQYTEPQDAKIFLSAFYYTE